MLGLLVFADRANLLLHDGGDWARYHDTQVRVVAVIDGDTIDVDLPDGTHATTRVRIWGIDTPELARDDREAEPFAEAAREHAKAIALGEVVTLKLQAHQTRGRFGRLVAYAQLGDGTYFGERMLIAGLAEADSRFSHDRIDRYELLQQQAQFDDVGMWAE